MGKVVEKKKKKGRPSLLDLQKRSLKQQQQQIHNQDQDLLQKRNPNPNPNFRNPNSTSNSVTPQRRSTRRNPNPDSERPENDEAEDSDDDEDSVGKRKEKKLKLVLKLPPGSVNSPSPPHHQHLRSSRSDVGSYGSDSNGEDQNGEETPLKKRRINAVGGDGSAEGKAERFNSARKATGSTPGAPSDSGPTTPFPDKKLLVFILDRLQKKDTYGVFSEPVDPKELPDYHEVIEHPMDFGTVRKKLSTGFYANLEQFEKDVFLICSNAMRYNAPDTIYFRQARSIQELARKNFENLKQDDEGNEPELKTAVRRGRPPGKSSAKRPVGRPPLERACSDFSSDATLATAGDNAGWSNLAHDTLRKFAGSTDLSSRNSHGIRGGETFGWLEHRSERNDEFSGFKGLSKVGKKQFVFDENRRSTYNQSLQSISGGEPTILSIFDGERKQLIPVGLHMEHAYARSLARFAANLGPVAWKVASKRIERALPPGLKFGPGWVGEQEAPRQQLPLLSSSPTQPPLPSLPQQLQSTSQPRLSPCTTMPWTLEPKSDKPSEKQEPSNNSSLEGSSRTPPSTATRAVANRSSDTVEGSETIRGTNYESGFSFGMRPKAHFQLQQNPTIQPPVNGFNSGFGFNLAAQVGKFMRPAGVVGNLSSEPSTPSRMVDMASRRNNTSIQHSMPTNCVEAEGAKLLVSSNSKNSGNSMPDSTYVGQTGTGSGLHQQPSWRGLSQKADSVPPDLNIRFQSPGSPASGMLVDSQQPDLALQL